MTATVQKVGAMLKKAGFDKAERAGKGDWPRSGYLVSRLSETAAFVSFALFCHGETRTKADMHHRYAEVLRANGFDVEDRGSHLVVK